MAVAKTMDVWKLKKWWPIIAPKYLGRVHIGETPAIELKSTIGRTINISLAAITNDIKQQHINATFKITSIDGNNATTELIKYQIAPAYIRRHMRKGRTKVTDSFICKTAENDNIRIKPLVITKSKIAGSQETAIRKIAKATLKEAISKMSYEQFVQELLSQRLQRKLGDMLRKISPLKSCEIRMMELIKKEKFAEKAISEEKKEEEVKKEAIAEEKAKEEQKLQKRSELKVTDEVAIKEKKTSEVHEETKEKTEKPKKSKSKQAESF